MEAYYQELSQPHSEGYHSSSTHIYSRPHSPATQSPSLELLNLWPEFTVIRT